MCTDLLPENVNEFLDDVETGLCLPILLLIVLCTLQFIINHILDIACTVVTLVSSSSSSSSSCEKDPSSGTIDPLMDFNQLPQKLKGMLSNIGTRLAGVAWSNKSRRKELL
ncbi:uncharacterized protein [Venturia canescens]|uniref:uncharacterized protein n=1 Tax=Venturia canescens TaxID=32260 RepID=UPI001C9C44F1|nr:uncharacterized protein LOC122417832 [Venturia canescens]